MPDQHFDAMHPTGTILFRATRGGILQGIQFADNLFDVFDNAEQVAEAILLTADVSHLEAAMEVRAELIAGGTPPTAAVPTPDDLYEAKEALRRHAASLQREHPYNGT